MRKELLPRLKVKEYSFWVHLGCSAEERSISQEVKLSLEIQFPEPPPGEKTDRLEDTVCYAVICETIEKFVAGKQFSLVEYLARGLYLSLKEEWPGTFLQVELLKINPPIKNLRGGVSYFCGDSFR